MLQLNPHQLTLQSCSSFMQNILQTQTTLNTLICEKLQEQFELILKNFPDKRVISSGEIPVLSSVKYEEVQPVDKADYKRKSKRDLDFDCLDYVEKKVKKDETIFTPTTEEEEKESNPIEAAASFKQKTKKVSTRKKEGTISSRVVEVLLDKNANKMIFKIQNGSGSKEKTRMMTREELIKEDPKLLLGFYEKHLQFVKMPDFDPVNLELP